jgi:Dolichyl-phosphate-mannose-protein mannosyltransferase
MDTKRNSLVETYFENNKLYLLPLTLFIVFGLSLIDAPGLYMDSVNPDYLASWLLKGDVSQPAWIYPDNILVGGYKLPLLTSLYGGNITAYLGALFFSIFGFGIWQVRLFHLLLGVLTFLSVNWLLRKCKLKKPLLLFTMALLATSVTFIFSWRTQYYLQLFPIIFFLLAVGLSLNLLEKKNNDSRTVFLIGLFLGLSGWCYFIYVIYAFAFMVTLFSFKLIPLQSKSAYRLVLGFFIGWSPYIYAHLSILASFGITEYINALKGLQSAYGVVDTTQGFLSRFYHVYTQLKSLTSGTGLEEKIFGQKPSKGIQLLIVQTLYASLILMACIASLYSKNKTLRFITVSLIVVASSHILFGILVGAPLNLQHYIMLLPIGTILVGVGFHHALLLTNTKLHHSKKFAVAIGFIFFALNFSLSISFLKKLKENTGVGYYSSAINSGIGYASGLPQNTLFVFPQWGYWMPFMTAMGPETSILQAANFSELIASRDLQQKTTEASSIALIFGQEISEQPPEQIDIMLKKFAEYSNSTFVHYIKLQGKGSNTELMISYFINNHIKPGKSEFIVENWGPQETTVNSPVNVQPSGYSAFWIKTNLKLEAEELTLFLGEKELLDMAVHDDGLITASFPVDYIQAIGTQKLVMHLKQSRQQIIIGEFIVLPAKN